MKFTRYEYTTQPAINAFNDLLEEAECDNKAIRAAGFDPDDEEIACCRLTEEWNGHRAGSYVVTGNTVSGHPFAVEREEV